MYWDGLNIVNETRRMQLYCGTRSVIWICSASAVSFYKIEISRPQFVWSGETLVLSPHLIDQLLYFQTWEPWEGGREGRYNWPASSLTSNMSELTVDNNGSILSSSSHNTWHVSSDVRVWQDIWEEDILYVNLAFLCSQIWISFM